MARYMASISLLRLSRPQEARKELELLRTIFPSFAKVPWRLGLLDMAQGQLTNARAQLEIAQGLDPQDPWILNSLGDVLRRQGKVEDALGYHQSAVALAGDQPALFVSLGRDHFAQDNLPAALSAFAKAYRLDPSRRKTVDPYAVVLLHQSKRSIRTGKFREAAKHLDTLQKLDARKSEVHLTRATLAMAEGRAVSAFSRSPSAIASVARVRWTSDLRASSFWSVSRCLAASRNFPVRIDRLLW